MTQVQVPSGHRPALRGVPSPVVRRAQVARYYFPATAAVLLAFSIIGFLPYFTQGIAYPNRPVAPPMKWVVFVHAIVMSAWMALLMVQPTLVFARKTKLHMTLGKVGAVVATVVFVTGLWVGIRSAQVTPDTERIWGLPPNQFLIVPFTAALIFGTFVALAIWKRKTPAKHRVLMILGTLWIMSAPISRIDLFNNLYLGTVWERLFGPFFITMILASLLLGVHWGLTQKLDRLYAGGVAVFIALAVIIWQLAPTPVWTSIAAMMV